MPKTTSLDLRELTEPFNAWCAQRRICRSLAIRQLVKKALGNDAQLPLLSPEDPSPPAAEWDGLARIDGEPRHCFTLRVTRSQREHLRVRAAAAGISCSHFILAAITARDSDAQPIAGQDAVQALVRSNDLLAKTALKLSAWNRAAAAGGTDLVKEVQAVVREHLVHAAAVVSHVEATRIGRTYKSTARKKAADAKPGGPRQSARALG